MTLFPVAAEFDRWFAETVGSPTGIQRAAWPVLRRGRNALLIAATGQGKSLAAWRPLVERIAGEANRRRGVRALHIAPLKALSRDMTHNLAELLDVAGRLRGRPVEIALRCGDTPQAERARHRRKPPDILSTTPESLFVLLGSAGGRKLLTTVEAVVVDELHALAGSKRGAHLALSLARLDRLAGRAVQRIGLSATARPAAALARFLAGKADCEIVAPQPPGAVALRVELPDMPLGTYPNSVHFRQIHQRIAELAGAGGSLLVFCQTRAQVERSAAALDELLADAGLPGQVGAHHGSLDTTHREGTEARFKKGKLRILVSSASLELGLDLGHVDRVCQIGVPGSANLVRQRAGRSGHRPGRKPCMHLFPLTLNQLVETRALADALASKRIDAVEAPAAPLDVLAQHLVAMVAGGERTTDQLLAIARTAWPYRDLSGEVLESLLQMLAEPPANMPAEQFESLIVRETTGEARTLPQADRLALTNAGTIPEFFEYDVVRTDTGEQVGTLDEEFAFESSPGQVLQLGRRAWRIVRVLTGQVRVEPADEEPAHMPFWFGEGPGRTKIMAEAMLQAIASGKSSRLHPQAAAMLAESGVVLGQLPSPQRLVIERFADPGGDRHVVLHTFAGARINRAWGLALRKRFCRRFNFELQAAATDDGILISLGVTSRFELAEVTGFVRSHEVADVLTQALLDTPQFVTRFRWCANNALVLLKNGLQGPLSAQRQRSQAENLIACVFPDQLACLENLSGPRQVPDHPLVRQALVDCLHEHMDLEGLIRLLGQIEEGWMAVHAVDTRSPSPLAEALIHAPRHSYLDDAAAEERRTRNFEQPANRQRPFASGQVAARAGSGKTSPDAGRLHHQSVRARRDRRQTRACGIAAMHPSADALEQLLLNAGFLTAREGESGLGLAHPVPAGGWTHWFSRLVRERRALTVSVTAHLPRLWIAADRLGWLLELDPSLERLPWPGPSTIAEDSGGPEAVLQWLHNARARIEGEGASATIAQFFPDPARATADLIGAFPTQ